MDELDALRQLRSTLAEAEPAQAIALRTNWRPDPDLHQRARHRWRAPVVGLVAAAAVVAGYVTTVSLATDSGSSARTTTRRPGNALLVAATNSLKAPAGQWWHTSRYEGTVYGVGKSAARHFKVESRTRYDAWTTQGGKGVRYYADLNGRPWTAEDRQKWVQAGSPKEVEVPNNDGDSPALVSMTAPSPAAPQPWPRDNGQQRFYGMTPGQIAALPTEPKALENALLGLKGDWRAYAPKVKTEPLGALRGGERARALSDVAGTLLAEAPAPAKVRAAAFRMLATMPGVEAGGQAIDPLGRTGTVVSLPLETTMPLGVYSAPKQLGTYRRQWIIDPGSGTLLAIRDLVAKPPRGSRKLPPGDSGQSRRLTVESQPDRFHQPGEVSSYTAYAIAEWTDAQPS